MWRVWISMMNEPGIRFKLLSFAFASRWLRNLRIILPGLVAASGLVLHLRTLTVSDGGVSWRQVFAWIEHDWPGVPQMNTAELERRLNAQEDHRPFLIDVRSREEYDVSHLPDAVWADSPDQIRALVHAVSAARPIVVYCSIGIRSTKAAQQLIDEGYTNVFNLKGSIFKWANEGRLLVRNGKPVHQVHPYNRRWGRLLDRTYHGRAGFAGASRSDASDCQLGRSGASLARVWNRAPRYKPLA
jgi:rhodanese-related sulfurtransferase